MFQKEMELKPRICFEVEKVLGVSSDGNYQVQWAPAWVSKYHLVGCEHLIQEFLQQQEQEQEQKQQQEPKSRQQQHQRPQEQQQQQQQKQHQKQKLLQGRQLQQHDEQKSDGEYIQYFEDNEEDVSVTLLPNDCTTEYPECGINCDNEDDAEMVVGAFDGHFPTSTTQDDEDPPMNDSPHKDPVSEMQLHEDPDYPDIRITEIKTETVSPDDVGEHASYFSSQPQQHEQQFTTPSHNTYQYQQQRPGKHIIAFINKTKKEKSSQSPKKHACSLCGKTFARRYLILDFTYC